MSFHLILSLDRCIPEQRCNMEVVEQASDLSFADVVALCEWLEDAQAQALAATAHRRST